MSLTDIAPVISTATTAKKSFEYQAHIDGLRAIAVLGVLFFHFGAGCSGGYVGVDVFFVISGYLITGLILKEMDSGQFHIYKFWERRVLRILPALTVVILACLVVGFIILLPQDFAKMGKSIIAQATLVSNVYFWKTLSYFADKANPPLLHTWSLAVEEQFYLIFPCLMLLLIRISRKLLVPAALVLCSLSFCLSIHWSYAHADANYYLPFTRAWELGIGALLAIISSHGARRRWAAESLSWAGFLSIMCAMFLYSTKTRFPGVTALLPCLGTFAIIWANECRKTSVGKILSTRPMVFVGLISYSLYLWHWPIFVFSKYMTFNPHPLSVRMMLLLMSLVPAFLSWKYIERPFRKRTIIKSRLQIFSFAGAVTLLLLLFGVSICATHGLPGRFTPAAMTFANGATDLTECEVSLEQALAGDLVEIGSTDKRKPIEVLVWGDSHARAVLPLLECLCEEYNIRGVAAIYSSTCPAVGFQSNNKYSLGKDSIRYNDAIVRFVRDKQVRNVLMVARWKGYVDSNSDMAELNNSLINTVIALKDTGTQIWIMRQAPEQLCDNVPAALAIAVEFDRGDPDDFGISLAEQREAQKKENLIFQGLSELSYVHVLDPTDMLTTSQGLCHVAKDGKSLYADSHHLTTAGAMELRPLFKPLFDPISLNNGQTSTDNALRQ